MSYMRGTYYVYETERDGAAQLYISAPHLDGYLPLAVFDELVILRGVAMTDLERAEAVARIERRRQEAAAWIREAGR